jgi:hypothetical protein
MSKKDYIRIASISVEDWIKIHRFCLEHDVLYGIDVKSGICREMLYSPDMGGAIRMWKKKNWDSDRSEFCTYYPKRSDQLSLGEMIEDAVNDRRGLTVLDNGGVEGAQWVDIMFSTGGWEDEGIDYVIENGNRIPKYSEERNWSPEMGRKHFMELYEEVTGEIYRYGVAYF